jgi:uncharacterized protein
MNLPLTLRGHHLHCLLTYVGEGYSVAFVSAMDDAAAHVAASGEFEVVEGPDSLCDTLEGACGEHCGERRNLERDRVAKAAVQEVLGRALNGISSLSRADLDALRLAFQTRPEYRASCTGCEWATLCSYVANRDFTGTRLIQLAPIVRSAAQRR